MPTEAGDMKLLGNFRQLIEFISADPNYNPSNAAITKTALEAKDTGATIVAEDVPNKNAAYRTAVRERSEAFEPLRGRSRQVRNVAKASGASEAVLANLDTPLRKLSGERASERIKDDPNTPEDESAGQRSVSQMSYDNQVGHFRSFVALVKELPTYEPNENELKIAALEAYANELEAKNTAVIVAFVPLSQARTLRDQVLYTEPDSVASIASRVKAYVKGAFGVHSPLYLKIKGLQFLKKN